MASLLKDSVNVAVVQVLKKKLHEEATAFDTFIEKYHSFIGDMREARKILPKEMEKCCHLLPFEKHSDNELTILLEAPPVRSAGLFATKFLQKLHQATSIKEQIDEMCEDYYKKSPPENMDVDLCEKLFHKIAVHLLEEEGYDALEDIKKMITKLLREHKSEEEKTKKMTLATKFIRFLKLFLTLVPKINRPVPSMDTLLKGTESSST